MSYILVLGITSTHNKRKTKKKRVLRALILQIFMDPSRLLSNKCFDNVKNTVCTICSEKSTVLLLNS